MNENNGSKLLSVVELAKHLAVSRRTIWNLVARGELPAPINLGSRLRRWRLRDIEAHLDKLAQGPK